MIGVQRRLAAIVCADVVGYSRLMGNNESGTLAALKAHRRELFDPKHVDRATYCVNHAQGIS
jgi:class 3 adenylate cyclase